MPEGELDDTKLRNVLAEEVARRIAALQHRMREAGLDGAFLLHRPDLYYFCGTAYDAVCCLPSAGEPLLAVRRPFERARGEAAIPQVVHMPSYSALPHLLAEHGVGKLRRVGIEQDVVPVLIYRRFQQLFPDAEWDDVSPLVMRVRQRKSSFELACLRRAAAVVDAGHRALPAILRDGVAEVDALADLLAAFIHAGDEGSARMRRWDATPVPTTVLSGWNGAVPSFVDATTGGVGLNRKLPFGSSRKLIRAGEPIMVDSVCAHAGYCVDISRTYAIGSLEADLREAHALSVEIVRHLEGMMVPGVQSGELYAAAAAMASRTPYSEAFLGCEPYRVSFVGHGIGLEVSEPPFLARGFTTPLEAGMVVALEPKFVFPDKGIVGIENTYAITETGPERLSSLPDDLVILA